MDEHPGSQSIPLTLNKYLYGNADPVNHIDPGGNFSLGGMMSGIGSIANLSLRVLTVYDLIGTINDDEVKDTIIGLIVLATGGPTGLANAALNSTNTTKPLSSGIASLPQKHHTIPEYLCGHSNQVLSTVPHHEHVKIHAALYTLRVSAINGQKLIMGKIMRKPTQRDKNKERFLLGGIPWEGELLRRLLNMCMSLVAGCMSGICQLDLFLTKKRGNMKWDIHLIRHARKGSNEFG